MLSLQFYWLNLFKHVYILNLKSWLRNGSGILYLPTYTKWKNKTGFFANISQNTYLSLSIALRVAINILIEDSYNNLRNCYKNKINTTYVTLQKNRSLVLTHKISFEHTKFDIYKVSIFKDKLSNLLLLVLYVCQIICNKSPFCFLASLACVLRIYVCSLIIFIKN